jgi:ribosomal protein S25
LEQNLIAQEESATKILDYLKENGLVSTRRITQELGLQMDVARSLLNQLWEEQKIGRKIALDASSADASGGAELWHIVGWKNGPQSSPIEPKAEFAVPSSATTDTIPLQPEKSTRHEVAARPAPQSSSPSPARRKVRQPLELRVAALEALTELSRPSQISQVSKRTRMKNENARAALRILTREGLVASSRASRGSVKETCPTCGAPTSGKELYKITPEGRQMLRWLRRNHKAVKKLQAIS